MVGGPYLTACILELILPEDLKQAVAIFKKKIQEFPHAGPISMEPFSFQKVPTPRQGWPLMIPDTQEEDLRIVRIIWRIRTENCNMGLPQPSRA